MFLFTITSVYHFLLSTSTVALSLFPRLLYLSSSFLFCVPSISHYLFFLFCDAFISSSLFFFTVSLLSHSFFFLSSVSIIILFSFFSVALISLIPYSLFSMSLLSPISSYFSSLYLLPFILSLYLYMPHTHTDKHTHTDICLPLFFTLSSYLFFLAVFISLSHSLAIFLSNSLKALALRQANEEWPAANPLPLLLLWKLNT